MSEALLRVENLTKTFPIHGGIFSRQVAEVKAVQNVSFEIKKGETLGLVGESGCGKSTLGRAILRLHEPTSGKIIFHGQDITQVSKAQMQSLRRKMQIIFQDPYASLNPRMTVQAILEEPLIIHGLFPNSNDRKNRVLELMNLVGLRPEHLSRYPHEFSGGQRQRIGIARALAVEPELIICDEPVSALDVSIQAQIVNLLMDLQQKLGLTYIFIAHDLRVVEHMSHKVAVMYLGEIAELSEAANLYKNPQHPYTKALLSSIPIPDPRAKKEKIILKGDLPSPLNPPTGCFFHTRCPWAQDICKTQKPQLHETKVHSLASCHFV